MHILTLGLNHRTTPVQLREQLAFPESLLQAALPRLVGEYGLAEAAILSTCNRSEIYVASDAENGLSKARQFLTEVRGIDLSQFEPHFYEFSNEDAVTHLFSVACGIDSMVIGESQILGQVRDALELARQNDSAHIVLNELFQRSLRVGKRARSETDIGRGHLSISTAAVELANQIFENLKDRRGILVGTGEMGELIAQYLIDASIQSLTVTNRTHSRAQELAVRLGAEAIEFEHLAKHLESADIAITATASSEALAADGARDVQLDLCDFMGSLSAANAAGDAAFFETSNVAHQSGTVYFAHAAWPTQSCPQILVGPSHSGWHLSVGRQVPPTTSAPPGFVGGKITLNQPLPSSLVYIVRSVSSERALACARSSAAAFRHDWAPGMGGMAPSSPHSSSHMFAAAVLPDEQGTQVLECVARKFSGHAHVVSCPACGSSPAAPTMRSPAWAS